jgi:Domain of unknown function DUF29
MRTNASLYEQDFYAWVQEQAALLKARQFEALDLDNLIDEVESLARQERHLLWHRFRTLLTHLVAWWGEIPARCSQWEGVITAQRQELQDILADSPSLAPLALEELAKAWESVRTPSAEQWSNAAFPVACPWTLAQVLDEDFWPPADTFRAQTKEARHAPGSPLDADHGGVA